MKAIAIDILWVGFFECNFKKPNLIIYEQSFSLKTVFFSIKFLSGILVNWFSVFLKNENRWITTIKQNRMFSKIIRARLSSLLFSFVVSSTKRKVINKKEKVNNFVACYLENWITKQWYNCLLNCYQITNKLMQLLSLEYQTYNHSTSYSLDNIVSKILNGY